MLKYMYVVIGRDSGNVKLPFKIVAKLPKAKKGRVITKRDEFGRILAHRVPNYF